jgi:hypothetical protein
MHIISLLRAGVSALVFGAVVAAAMPSFAADQNAGAQLRNSSAPYDDASFEAAKHAFY